MFNLSPQFLQNTGTDSFYRYVNENWITNTSIPDDERRWGAFNELSEDNLNKIDSLFQENIESTDSEIRKLLVLYNQIKNFERDGKIEYLKPRLVMDEYIQTLSNLKTKEELSDFILKHYVNYDLSTPVNFMIYNDFNDANNNILHISSGGLGLGDRDYYLDDSKKDIIEKYKIFMKEYLELFILDYNQEDLDNIFNIEYQLAESSYTNVEKRNPLLMNNPTTTKYIEDTYPEVNIRQYFEMCGIEYNDRKVNLINEKFLKKYIDIFRNTDLNVLKKYYTWIFLRQLSGYISLLTEVKSFEFYSRTLSGTKKMKPLWKRSIYKVESLLGMVVGKMFVNKYFKESSKDNVQEMILFIKNELKNSIETNTWMESSTKEKALIKLGRMNFKIGYPDKWRDFSSVDISEDNSLVRNVLNCLRHEAEYDRAFLYKETDKTLWFMNPHDVNAYYSPSFNEIVFPAGILQEPFYSEKYSASINFGAIGAVIGHEMTHGFDDQGKKYDGDGNLNNWWTNKDSLNYSMETKKLKILFDTFKLAGTNVNGELTLGENIADLGGMNIVLSSLNKYLINHPEKNENGLTPQQKLFISNARIWRAKTREEEVKKRLLEDPHSPPQFRVDGNYINIADFYNEFNINTNSNLWLDERKRTKIW